MNPLRAQLEAASLPFALPELVVTPTHMEIFMFSAATWNRHHVHYSKDAAVEEGLPDVVVQRALLGNYLARSLSDWMGDDAEIRRLSWKVVNSATPNMPLRCQGSVIEADAEALTCRLRIVRDDDEAVVSGSARLLLTRAS